MSSPAKQMILKKRFEVPEANLPELAMESMGKIRVLEEQASGYTYMGRDSNLDREDNNFVATIKLGQAQKINIDKGNNNSTNLNPFQSEIQSVD